MFENFENTVIDKLQHWELHLEEFQYWCEQHLEHEKVILLSFINHPKLKYHFTNLKKYLEKFITFDMVARQTYDVLFKIPNNPLIVKHNNLVNNIDEIINDVIFSFNK
jgi:hypothetical protein